jgi:hypothetical protein
MLIKNINISIIPGFGVLELFMVIAICIAGTNVSNAQTNTIPQLKFSSQTSMLSEGAELVVYVTNLDSGSYNNIFWTVPADWLVNGEYTHGIDFENDTMVIITVGATSGSIAAHVFQHNTTKHIQVAANFRVIPTSMFEVETENDEESPFLYSVSYLNPAEATVDRASLSKR